MSHPGVSVPSSNTPPIFEWAGPTWYTLRLAARQASEALDDAQAGLLVKFFEAQAVTLPCPECKSHYVRDWEEAPFTLEHARSVATASKWVEDLRTKIDVRAAQTRSIALSALPAPPVQPVAAVQRVAAVPPINRLSHSFASRGIANTLRVRTSVVPPTPSARTVPTVPTSRGRGGCGCGGR